ncbi:hypothetical protein BCR43DRAFT_539789 [Syncephalastrum racemosum]|uniref:Uncharacterized protein n=1 Tax=Syncephalastrum racemosum TaxID=13706 RepID=A0A1X2HL01_SYNRA|nr:hypothetical protein BCR43DRAFT_539789 [Syncephalastrum racemosum]
MLLRLNPIIRADVGCPDARLYKQTIATDTSVGASLKDCSDACSPATTTTSMTSPGQAAPGDTTNASGIDFKRDSGFESTVESDRSSVYLRKHDRKYSTSPYDYNSLPIVDIDDLSSINSNEESSTAASSNHTSTHHGPHCAQVVSFSELAHVERPGSPELPAKRHPIQLDHAPQDWHWTPRATVTAEDEAEEARRFLFYQQQRHQQRIAAANKEEPVNTRNSRCPRVPNPRDRCKDIKERTRPIVNPDLKRSPEKNQVRPAEEQRPKRATKTPLLPKSPVISIVSRQQNHQQQDTKPCNNTKNNNKKRTIFKKLKNAFPANHSTPSASPVSSTKS